MFSVIYLSKCFQSVLYTENFGERIHLHLGSSSDRGQGKTPQHLLHTVYEPKWVKYWNLWLLLTYFFLFVLWFDISRSISQCKKHLMVWLVCQLCCTLERGIHHTQISWIKNYQGCEKTAITCDITLNSVTRFGEITNWYSFPAKR